MLPFVTTIISRFGNGFKKLRKSDLLPLIVPFILLIAIGTIVYSRLEGWTLVESLYATIITITTVGYGDYSPQTPEGRVFAIFFTIFAIGLAGYALSTVAAVILDGQQEKFARKRLEKRMKKIQNLSGHIIVCGGGALGTRASVEVRRRNTSFVVIESDEEKLKSMMLWLHESYLAKRFSYWQSLETIDLSVEESMTIAQLAEETGVLYMLEDPADEHQLLSAGVHKALGVIAAMEDDRDNMSICLSARNMAKRLDNPNLRIVASASETMMHTLYLAGADRVVSTTMQTGFSLASQMLDHDTAEFMEQMLYRNNEGMRFGDMQVSDHPEIIGRTCDDVRKSLSQMIVSIRRDGAFINVPEPTETIRADDVLIVMGPQI